MVLLETKWVRRPIGQEMPQPRRFKLGTRGELWQRRHSHLRRSEFHVIHRLSYSSKPDVEPQVSLSRYPKRTYSHDPAFG